MTDTAADAFARPATRQVSDETITDQELYRVLWNIRRRYVMYYLETESGPVDVGELADQIDRWENLAAGGDYATNHRKSVYNALKQTHIPKLERAGLVDYDRPEKTVTATKKARTIELYPRGESVPWRRYFTLLSVATVALIGVAESATVSVPLLDEFHWMVGLLLVHVGLSLGYNYDCLRWRRRFREMGPDVFFDGSHEG